MQAFLIAAFLVMGMTSCDCDNGLMASEPQAFWPPDMVPHPHPPQVPDKDDNLA